MKKLKVHTFGDPILRKTASPVTVFHKGLHEQIDNIAYTLDSREDGAAFAAPQLGISKRIAVIDAEGEYFELVNPEVLDMSGEQTGYEGCLSFPGFKGKVTRADRIKIKYQDRNGKYHEAEKNGFMARCFQHEIDHLDGILFIDRVNEDFLVNDDNKGNIPLDVVRKLSEVKDTKI